MKVLIKYKNRKIYSPDIKRYVNLDEITSMIKQGEKISIRAYETNGEVTNEVLKQCLVNLNVNQNDLINLINKGE
jgi:polyhydroxyalkanoate synthesis regulator protein